MSGGGVSARLAIWKGSKFFAVNPVLGWKGFAIGHCLAGPAGAAR